jgi:hypothetical protein
MIMSSSRPRNKPADRLRDPGRAAKIPFCR